MAPFSEYSLPPHTQCSHEGCLAKFSKNKQLRGHVAAEHGVQGMKNFKCDHDGCTKAFATNQKLTVHLKVHDGTDVQYNLSPPKNLPDV